MTLAQLIAKFRTYSDDIEDPYLWSDDQITGYYNDAVKEACVRQDLIFDTTSAFCTIDVVSDTATYALDSSILKIMYAIFSGMDSPTDIIYRNELNATYPDWRKKTGEPLFIISDEKTITVVPDPSVDYTLTLEVVRVPVESEEMTLETHSPVISDIYHEELSDWVLYAAYMMRDIDKYSPDRAAHHYRKFEKFFGEKPNANRRARQRRSTPRRVPMR